MTNSVSFCKFFDNKKQLFAKCKSIVRDIFAICLVAVFVPPAHCDNKETDYFSPNLQLRIAHRPGWKIEGKDQAAILSPSSLSGVSIRIQRTDGQKRNLSEFWKAPQVPGKRRIFTNINGLKAVREESTEAQNGPYADHYIAVRDNAIYTIDLSAPRQNIQVVKPAFDAILASIQWTDSQGHIVSYAPPPGETLEQLRKRAESGDKKAQLDLGAKYHFGKEVPKDEVEALKWFQKSAEQGYDRAYYNLGTMYMNGEGVPVDTAKGAEYFRKSAEAGFARAQLLMGRFCEEGVVVPRDISQSKMWYQKAAAGGSPEAAAALKQIGSSHTSWRNRLTPIFGLYLTAMPTDMLFSVIAGYLLWPLAIGALLLFGILVARKRRWNKPTVGALLFVLPGMYAGMYSLGFIFGGSVVYWSGAFYGLAGEFLGYLIGWSIFSLFKSKDLPSSAIPKPIASNMTSPSLNMSSKSRNPVAVWIMGIFLLAVCAFYAYHRYETHLWEKIWSKNTTPSEYIAIANNIVVQHSHGMANELGRNLQTPIEALLALRGTPVWKDVDGWAVRRGDAPRSFLDETMQGSDIALHRNVAQNPKLPADIAQRLSTENDVDIRMALVQNPSTPIEILEQMAQNDPVSKSWIEGYIKNRKLALEPGRPSALDLTKIIGMSADDFEKEFQQALASKHQTPDTRFEDYMKYVRKGGGHLELTTDQISIIHPWFTAFGIDWTNGHIARFTVYLNKPMKDEEEFRHALSLPQTTAVKMYGNASGYTAAEIR